MDSIKLPMKLTQGNSAMVWFNWLHV